LPQESLEVDELGAQAVPFTSKTVVDLRNVFRDAIDTALQAVRLAEEDARQGICIGVERAHQPIADASRDSDGAEETGRGRLRADPQPIFGKSRTAGKDITFTGRRVPVNGAGDIHALGRQSD